MVPLIPIPDLSPAAYGPAVYGDEALMKRRGTTRDESARKLRELLPPNTKLAAEPEYLVGMDFLPEGILDTATAHRIDLIVMGANRTASPRVAAHIPWALTHKVICHAKCPVLTVSN